MTKDSRSRWYVDEEYPRSVSTVDDVPVATFNRASDAHAAVKAHNDSLKPVWTPGQFTITPSETTVVDAMITERHAQMKVEQNQRDLGGGAAARRAERLYLDPMDDAPECDLLQHEIERLNDVVEEFRKREQSQDTIRERLTDERDKAYAAYDERFKQNLENIGRVVGAEAVIQRVKALHHKRAARDVCANDAQPWPCTTIHALEQP